MRLTSSHAPVRTIPFGRLLVIAALCVLAALAGMQPAGAQTSETPKISNSDEGNPLQHALDIEHNSEWAQSFCTGPQPATLDKVRLWTEASGLDAASMPTVSIYSNDHRGPHRRVHTLTNPELDGRIHTPEDFTASGFELEASTRYWVVLERPSTSGTFRTTITNAGDVIEPGWSLGHRARLTLKNYNKYTGSPFWTNWGPRPDFYRPMSLRMDLYATSDGPTNAPPILGWKGSECENFWDRYDWSIREHTGERPGRLVGVAPSSGLDVSPLVMRLDEGTGGEADDETFQVALTSRPSAQVTVTVTAESGLLLSSLSTIGEVSSLDLTFTRSNWDEPQGVSVSTRNDSDALDELRTISLSASGGGFGSETGTVSVLVLDRDRQFGTVRAFDREGDTLTYSLGGSDLWKFNRLFTFNTSTGAVARKEGGYVDFEETVGYTASSAFHTYNLTVSVTDGKDDSGAAETVPTADHTVPVTIRVLNADDPGSVRFTRDVGGRRVNIATPTQGVAFRVTIRDQDGFILSSLIQRRIYRGDSADGSFSEISRLSGRHYTPVAADVGKYLRTTVRYIDSHCAHVTRAGPDPRCWKSASFTHPVAVAASSSSQSQQSQSQQSQSQQSQTSQPALPPVNSVAAGAPTIGGTPQVGETLTASTRGITDPDGLDDVEYSYQWLADDTPITDATDSSYTLTSSELDKVIKVRVTFTDDADNNEALISGAVGPVEAAPAPTQTQTQTQTQQSEERTPRQDPAPVKAGLSATVRDEPDSHDGTDFTFELRFSEEFYVSYKTLRDHAFDVTGGEVINARRLVHRKNVRWEITISPSSHEAVTVVLPATTDCTATGAICTRDQRMLSAVPTLEVPGRNPVTLSDVDPVVGTAVTASLTDAGSASGTVTWQWARSERPDSGFTDIDDTANGSSSAAYTPQSDDTAHFLRATARYRDGEGVDRVEGAVTILPVGVTASTLVSNTGELPAVRNVTQSGASSYQGFVTGDNPAGYVLTAAGVRFGVTVFDRDCYQVEPPWVELWTRQQGQDRPETRLRQLSRPASAQRHVVSVYDAPTAVVLEPSTEYYLRLRDGACISITHSDAEDSGGASGWSIADTRLYAVDSRAAFLPAESTIAGMIDIRGAELLGVPGPPREVSAASGAGSVTVSWLAPGSTGQQAVIKYEVRHKKTSDASFGGWVDVDDGDDAGTDVDDERSVTLSGLEADEQYTVQVRAVNASGGGPVAERLATPLAGEDTPEPEVQNSAAAGVPTIVGDPWVGETLTASTRGITDSDGLQGVVYAYQWLADDTDIVDADDSSYTLTSSEEGKTIKVRVTFVDGAGHDEALISTATPAVRPQLSATIHDEPSSHDESDFTFELRFSEDFYVSYKPLRDHAFSVTGGEVINARRLVRGESRRWEITVRPSSGGPVSIELPATTDCTAAGAICSPDRRKLTSGLQFEVAGPAAQNSETVESTTEGGTTQENEPLSATVHDEPNSHDGTDFTFELRFSEDFSISYRTLRDHAFRVTGGEVINARRFVHGKSRRWEITVRPSSGGPVSIELPATTDCTATGAICTGDQRMLTTALTLEVTGPGS